MWFLAGEALGELAVWPTVCSEVAKRGCLFAWNFSVTRTAVFTQTEGRTRPITTLSLRYDSPPAYRLKIEPAKNHARHYSFVPSVRPHISARLPLDGLPWNVILGSCMQVCLENSYLVTLGQKFHVLNMT